MREIIGRNYMGWATIIICFINFFFLKLQGAPIVYDIYKTVPGFSEITEKSTLS